MNPEKKRVTFCTDFIAGICQEGTENVHAEYSGFVVGTSLAVLSAPITVNVFPHLTPEK